MLVMEHTPETLGDHAHMGGIFGKVRDLGPPCPTLLTRHATKRHQVGKLNSTDVGFPQPFDRIVRSRQFFY